MSSLALIFGASGQDGFYLADLCQQKKVKALGVSRSGATLRGDVRNRAFVEVLIEQHQPAYIFHLAANSTPRHEALFENHETISTGTLNILEAVKLHSPKSKVFLCGSGLQFENIGKPIAESDPFAATSAYAFARIQSVYAARYYRSLGIKVYVGYFFHHESPRRGPRHVSQIIAQAARRIRDGSDEILELGDITVRKEWGFAGDIMQGVWLFIQQDEVFEATIGTGISHAIAEFLDVSFRYIRHDWKNHVRIREDFKSEYSLLVSNPTLIHSLGWQPTTTLFGLASMMIDIQ